MRNIVLSIFIFSIFPLVSNATITLEGTYQGKNIYVQNALNEDTGEYCVTTVSVNGEVLRLDNQSSAFEINLEGYGFAIGEPVVVKINHHDNCTPHVLGTHPLIQAHRTIRIEPAALDQGTLRWKHDTDLTDYQIEQYRWNKWVAVNSEPILAPTDDYYEYSLNNKTHSGTNTFRITAQDADGFMGYSNNLIMQGDETPVTYDLKTDPGMLIFSTRTRFELYDAEGNIILEGTTSAIEIAKYPKGDYYLNFDNRNEKIKVK